MAKDSFFTREPLVKVKKQLLYIVYGDNPNYHIETKLSILSALRHCKQPDFAIRVMTDQVARYDGWPVETFYLTPDLLQDWLGATQYHYRRKIVGIYTALDYAEQTVFVDTDTIFKDSPSKLFGLLKAGSIIVDKVEAIWEPDASSTVDSHLLETGSKESFSIFNSGVLGFFDTDKPLVKRGIEFVDELYPVDPKFRKLEQFAFALAVNKQRQLIEQPVLYHYYSKKEFFHEMGRSFFNKYGYGYQQNLVDQNREMPEAAIRPSYLTRFLCRIKVRSFPKKQRSGLLKLLYALNLKQEGYEEDHIVAYWIQAMNKDFSRYSSKAHELFQQGGWPEDYQKIISQQRKLELLSCLKKSGTN